MMTTYYPPYSFGGDGVFVHRLSNELARRGHEVEVIHSLDAYRVAEAPTTPMPYDDHPGVTVHGLRSFAGRFSALATHQTGRPALDGRRIRRILARGFDVIHYHNISLLGGPGVLSLGDAIKLYTMHDFWLVCPTHALFRNRSEPCAGPEGCLSCILAHRRPPQAWRYSGLLRSALRNVDALIAPSLTSQRKHEELGIEGDIVHIPNFVTQGENGDRPSARASDAAPYVLFAGRLEPLKGLETLIPAFRRYGRAQLWIAGSGSAEPAIRQLAGGHPNIRFLGQRSSRELQSLYHGAVALVYPAVNYQIGIPRETVQQGRGAPLVIMEAFSQRTPVVAHAVGTIPALLTDTGGGATYDTEDELLAEIDRLIDDPDHRDRLGDRGYEAFGRTWTAEAHLERYLGLIDRISERRVGSSTAASRA